MEDSSDDFFQATLEQAQILDALEACIPNSIDKMILRSELDALLRRNLDLQGEKIQFILGVLLSETLEGLIGERRNLKCLSKFIYVLNVIPEAPHLTWHAELGIFSVNASFLTLSTDQKVSCFNSAFEEYRRNNAYVD